MVRPRCHRPKGGQMVSAILVSAGLAGAISAVWFLTIFCRRRLYQGQDSRTQSETSSVNGTVPPPRPTGALFGDSYEYQDVILHWPSRPIGLSRMAGSGNRSQFRIISRATGPEQL